MADEYIRKQDAVDALDRIFDNVPMELTTEILRLRRELRGLPSTDVAPVTHGGWMDAVEKIKPADALPYTIDPDGTLTITVPKGTEVSRVLVQEDGTQWGGLFYAD